MTARLTDAERDQILNLARAGISRADIASQVGRSLWTISKVCSQAGVTFRTGTKSTPTPVDAGDVDDPPLDEVELRRAQVVHLYRQGLTFDDIGQRMNFSKQRAHKLYWDAMHAVQEQAVDAHRAAMVDELTEIVRASMAVLHAKHVVVSNGHVVSEIVGHHPLFDDETGEAHPKAGEPIYGDPLLDHGPTLDASRTIIAAHARLSKLIGADAPVKTELSGDVELNYTIRGIDADKL
jgi:hypothetical protein